jgi:hypothetical protein
MTNKIYSKSKLYRRLYNIIKNKIKNIFEKKLVNSILLKMMYHIFYLIINKFTILLKNINNYRFNSIF